MNEEFRKRRLIDALEYIDDEYIASAARYKMKIKPHASEPPVQTVGGSLKKYWKQYLGLVACLLLLAFASPIFSFVAQTINSIAGSWGWGATEAESSLEKDSITDKMNYEIPEDHMENAPYFIFSDDLEPISKEKIDEIRNVWYLTVYSYFYDDYFYHLSQSPLYYNDKEALEKQSMQMANDQAEEYKDILFGDTSIDHFRCRYYATLNDYVIFEFNTYLENEYTTMTVGNETISNSTSFYMLVYGDNKIVSLEEAYKNKWLSSSDIAIIKERHNTFNEMWIEADEICNYLIFTSELESISNEKMKAIREAIYDSNFTKSYQQYISVYQSDMYQYSQREAKEWAAKAANSSGLYHSDLFFNNDEEVLHYYYRYYGIINDCVVLVTYGSGEDFPTLLEIAGYTFSLPSNYKFEVYFDDEFIDISQAYKSGLMSEADIQILYERHLKFEEHYKNYKQKINSTITGG